MVDQQKRHENRLIEKKAIYVSIAGAFIISIIAIVVAFMTSSNAIMLDGMISFVFSGVGIIALRVLSLVDRDPDSDTPYGYYIYEPLLNFFRGFLILTVLIFAITAALEAISRGGRDVEAGYALVYAIFASVACITVGFWLNKMYKRSNSPILKVDSKEWQIDGFVSMGVGFSFIMMLLFKNSSINYIVPYIDPVVVLIISLFMIKIPLKVIQENWSEIIGKTPDSDIVDRVENIVNDSKYLENVQAENIIKIIKIGRMVFVQIYFIIPEDKEMSIKKQDEIRDELYTKLKKALTHLTLDLSFTHKDFVI